ncbi:hypothetical protein Poly41_16520 [Novipirellula artificiosorum]|uniref:Uncharacterized protein n=2 Tax=Novipirellula artificiosorum TaxID=2528016 RepID=A0A5C6DYB2_9BACT|nr:hypothetical protein Poly41_16520 [Novipirellula artificiosorum]
MSHSMCLLRVRLLVSKADCDGVTAALIRGVLCACVLLVGFQNSLCGAEADLSAWNETLESERFANCQVKVFCRTWNVTGTSVSSIYRLPDTPPRAYATIEVVRSGTDYWIRNTTGLIWDEESMEFPGQRAVNANLFNDQKLHLQSAGPIDTVSIESLSVSGKLERTASDLLMIPEYLLPARIFFGFDYSPSKPLQTIVEMYEASLNDRLDSTSRRVSVLESSTRPGLPSKIDREFASLPYDDEGLVLGPRNVSNINRTVAFDFQWDVVDGLTVPKHYILVESLGSGEAVLIHDFQLLDASFSDSPADYPVRPLIEIPDGYRISVSDVPVSCEWRDGRIQMTEGSNLNQSATAKFVYEVQTQWTKVFSIVALAAIAGALFLIVRSLRRSGKDC